MGNTAIGVVGLLLMLAALSAIVYQNQRRLHKPLMTTNYQAVRLTDGTLLYGRMDHLGTDFPVLRDVMTVRTIEDPSTKQTRYEVVPRKSGSHGADHIILPAASILYVEPVKPDSAVGRAIENAVSRQVLQE